MPMHLTSVTNAANSGSREGLFDDSTSGPNTKVTPRAMKRAGTVVRSRSDGAFRMGG